MELENFDAGAFLRDNWQKKALFIKNPWRNWVNPLAPDELAGLSCEEGIEARLICEDVKAAKSIWTQKEGPFDAADFARLGKSHWTLLVQAVDQFVPEVGALIAPFRFIPNWRIDDVMVSYAADQGSVGPHFDGYDVFLIQGHGRRKWRIGSICDANSLLLPHDDLRQLAQFKAQQEYVCEPGDIVYVPPGISHHGIALGDDCMTYSIGFRAPSRSELVAHFCDALLDDMADDDRYADPALVMQSNPGEINEAAIARLHDMVMEKIADRKAFARWFGTYNTLPKYDDPRDLPEPPETIKTVRGYVRARAILQRSPASRFAYIGSGANKVTLFVDGEAHECTDAAARFARDLCDQQEFALSQDLGESDEALTILVLLLNQGNVVFL